MMDLYESVLADMPHEPPCSICELLSASMCKKQ